MQTVKKLLFLLSSNERKQAALLLIMTIIMALLEMVGVASILPFIAVLSNPDIINTNLILNTTYKTSVSFGLVEGYRQFSFFLGILMFLLLVFSLSFAALTSYLQIRFVLMREHTIGKRLFHGYLNQPYSYFLDRHSAELGKSILAEVSQIIVLGFFPLMNMVARGMVAFALVTLLVLVDPKLALIVSLSLGIVYGTIFYFLRSYLKKIGEKRLNSNLLRFRIIGDAFGASKEIKMAGLEETYVKRFSVSAKSYGLSQASSQVISLLPRFFLETIAFGGILLILLYIIKQTGSFANSLPIISLYVFAGYRLIPAFQVIYSSSTNLTFVAPTLDKIYDDLKNFKTIEKDQEEKVIKIKELISLNNVQYNYPNTSRTTLKNINLSIPVNTTVGLVGATGCGKTTTVDIILGLLEAQKGTLEVDGKVITKQNARSWQRSLGYVPQQIYLSDDTITANIAFGVEPKDINQEAVEKASKVANLHDFISEELPKKYQTEIGEKGVRLSGGQRQRIGIARALYHSPKVLILDEATSALDNQTEKAVMDAVNNLSKSITIIIIAHRLSTLKKCDKIFLLEKGEIKDQGTFEELIKTNENFNKNASNQ
jgi:ABC-type multidrug transport system fused ATPase/permease subunit